MGDELKADEERVDAAKAGDAEAAGQLFEEHWANVWRAAYALLGRRDDADEIAQDAFVTAFSKLDQFEGRSSFRTWVTRIAINKALNTLRRERRFTPLWVEHQSPDNAQSSVELLDAVARLSVERRTVIVLRYWLGCSIEEISDLLELPTGTVNSRLARGLRQLRAALEVNCLG
jgi:RNA polymerase sigma-70 factor, ECF subfamily